MRFISSSLLLSGVLALTVAGCGNGGGGSASVELGVTAQALETSTLPPEGPGEAAQKHLVVTIDEVKLHVAVTGADDDADEDAIPGTDTDAETDTGKSGWRTAFSGETTINLFDATSTEALLSTIEVPAGKITQVRLVLSGAELVEGATKTPVTCPSCAETGLKIILGGKVDVLDGDKLHLDLDFDQASSLTQDEAGYRLAPVVKLVKAAKD